MPDLDTPTVPRAEPVTVVVSRRVKPDRALDYEAWIRDITRIALTFEGHLGMNVFRPHRAGDPYVLVYKFDSGAHLDAWVQSPERARMIKLAEELVDESLIENASGLESWFTLPGAKDVVHPPKWKMALITSAAVWIVSQALRPPLVAGLGFLPGPVLGLVTTVVMVSLLTWVIMPRVTKLLAPWLFAGKQ